jgi:hypothetical protein
MAQSVVQNTCPPGALGSLTGGGVHAKHASPHALERVGLHPRARVIDLPTLEATDLEVPAIPRRRNGKAGLTPLPLG